MVGERDKNKKKRWIGIKQENSKLNNRSEKKVVSGIKIITVFNQN
jgi:hypothetical protein